MLGDGTRTHPFSRFINCPFRRRIDIIVIPWCEWACAVLYFTGSEAFNRSMRLLAQKMGMHLSQHGLFRLG